MSFGSTDGFKRGTRKVTFFTDETLFKCFTYMFGNVSRGMGYISQGFMHMYPTVIKGLRDVFTYQELRLLIDFCDDGFPSPTLHGQALIHTIEIMFQLKNKGWRVDKEKLLSKLRGLTPVQLWFLEIWACSFYITREHTHDSYIAQLISDNKGNTKEIVTGV